ncbi:EAL domain-containing protein [Photobacterium sp. WH77]|uniref:EAL domain-containing protein n=1 Tax=Photobacterium arenosum TaxID=2774143 RepID=A0ABR9BIR8_9GAMM|nr:MULTISPECIES: HDOD domain-containing protein [Photobacterium]MBD8512445.1 EAL domain-containing protein [Photobacterium arenosum]MBV7260805.1 EAL domain-containing protein [Photobacterium sp. WH24]MCG2835915.1 EAL domain-containing protein [Photobacterium sp. WH77]MCG2843408.1 EAL domain-containing protein [Photobacterium sp. WH80]
MYSYLARQPVLDREKTTIGYELLFRDGPKNCFPDVPPEEATNRLLLNNFFSNGSNDVCSGKLAFVNFPEKSLLKGTPLLFPSHTFVIEVLEDCTPSDTLLETVKDLYQRGYQIALDDFNPSVEWNRFLPFVHIIKFDLQLTPIDKARFFIRRHKDKPIQFLAEKVETYAEFKEAKAAGFHLFQGYFFSKPEMMQQKTLSPSALTTLRLYQQICQDVVNFDEAEEIIATDLSLSYKLLRHVNAITSNRAVPISSFKQALIYLGEERLRRFISFVATSHVTRDKPSSLYCLSLQRAHLCELLAADISPKLNGNRAFLTGLFSMLDSLLDQPLDVLIPMLPLDISIQDALIHRSGKLGYLLSLVCAYDHADWDQVDSMCSKLGLESEHVANRYLESLEWVTSIEELQ